MGSRPVDVDVLVTDQGAAARSRLTFGNGGDEMTWSFIPSNRTFRVVFTGFLPPGVPLEEPLEELPEQSLFSTPILISSDGLISETINPQAQEGLYIYEIFEGDAQLPWLNPLSEGRNFGGVEIPDPPRSRS